MMIGENIRKIRRSRDITQEQLAQLMYITPQAVSRWENGATVPDAESIVALARIFNCSADDILGIGTHKKEERIRYFKELAHKAAEPRPGDADGKEVIRVLRDALKEYPGEFELMKELSGKLRYYSYYYRNLGDGETFESMMNESRELLEYIIEHCPDGALTGDACRELYSVLRHGLGKKEEAKKYLEYFPELGQCREMIEFEEGTPSEGQLIEDLAYYLRFYDMSRIFCKTPEEQLHIVRRIEVLEKLYDLNCPPNDYLALIFVYAEFGDAEKTLFYLRKEAELAVKYDDPESEEYKSEMHNTPPDYRGEMARRLENAVFDFVRGTAEFEEILRMVSV